MQAVAAPVEEPVVSSDVLTDEEAQTLAALTEEGMEVSPVFVEEGADMPCMDVLDSQPESEAEAFSLLAYEEIMAEPTAESEITTARIVFPVVFDTLTV